MSASILYVRSEERWIVYVYNVHGSIVESVWCDTRESAEQYAARYNNR